MSCPYITFKPILTGWYHVWDMLCENRSVMFWSDSAWFHHLPSLKEMQTKEGAVQIGEYVALHQNPIDLPPLTYKE